MAAKRAPRDARPRRRGEPGRPSARPGPDPAEVAEDYVEAERDEGAELVERDPEIDDESDDMATGTVQDQLVYEGLEANRVGDHLPPIADAKRSRKRSAPR